MTEPCKYCSVPGDFLMVCENVEPRLFLSVSGAYLQLFDEEYPGFVDNGAINYCPMCGRKLREANG